MGQGWHKSRPSTQHPAPIKKIGIKNSFPHSAEQALGLRMEGNKKGAVLREVKALDEVDVGRGANIKKAVGYYGYVLGVIVGGGFVRANEGKGMGKREWNEVAGGLHQTRGGETQFVGLLAIGVVGGAEELGSVEETWRLR